MIKTWYEVIAYIKHWNVDKEVLIYRGFDKEIALEMVKGYTHAGVYVNVTEELRER